MCGRGWLLHGKWQEPEEESSLRRSATSDPLPSARPHLPPKVSRTVRIAAPAGNQAFSQCEHVGATTDDHRAARKKQVSHQGAAVTVTMRGTEARCGRRLEDVCQQIEGSYMLRTVEEMMKERKTASDKRQD